MRVINLYGGPSTGKSTTRANLFGLMKAHHLKVEEAPEYAKDLTYEKNLSALSNQFYVTGGQSYRLTRLEGQVDWCLSDSPLPLGILYVQPDGRFDADWYRSAIWGMFDSFENVNVFLRRVKLYQGYGRSQTEIEARALDERLRVLMAGRIDLEVDGDGEAHVKIFEHLKTLH